MIRPGGRGRVLQATVEEHELAFVDGGPVLRDGGQTQGLRLCAAPDKERYLYKRYRPETKAELRIDPLLRMIRWRRELPEGERRELDARCAWPIAAVGTAAEVHGVLVRLADDTMFERRTSRTGAIVEAPRHLDELTRSPERAQRISTHFEIKKAYYEPPYKLAVLGELLETINWLHEHGWAVGDLQLRNAVFTIEPRPRTYLLDCDSCVPLNGPGPMPPVDPEQWKRPVEQQGAPFDAKSDYYKFAWAVIRCVQETVETWRPDRAVLCAVMRSDLADTLIECGRTLPPAGTREQLREAAAVWPRLVIGNRLFINADQYTRMPWPVGHSAMPPAGVQTSGPATVQKPPPVPARQGSGWAIAAVVAILLVILIVFGMWPK
ncbi:hypothetical protein AB0M44_14065 [Streptosporangium subroseum]|uniref:hypothetical protein n=1 Tax=Streptosporangium subroseum TaxID=106412 RepID=UPI00342898BE